MPTSTALQVLIALVPRARYALHASLFKYDWGVAFWALPGVQDLLGVAVTVTIPISVAVTIPD